MLRCLVLLLALAVVAPAVPAGADGSVRCHLTDRRIAESSGLAASSEPGTVHTHNDSGDTARFFVVDETCATTGVHDVVAGAVDWEDMAASGDALFLADIGDNARARPFTLVHEVPEPEPDVSRSRIVPTTHVVVYEDGPRDAETFVVLPDGRFLVVEKTSTGPSGVYLDDGPAPVRVLRRVAEVDLDAFASPYEPDVHYSSTSRVLTTGGDVTGDGTRIVVRTYVEAFEWDVAEPVADTFAATPRRIALPPTQQGEAIAYTPDARAVVTTTEGVGGPVHVVPLD